MISAVLQLVEQSVTSVCTSVFDLFVLIDPCLYSGSCTVVLDLHAWRQNMNLFSSCGCVPHPTERDNGIEV